ncbi:MAG: UbiA family prenyltransferase [Candidatus Brocadia sp.]
MSRLLIYLKFLRPFTLFPPAIGMISGGITAFGAYPRYKLSSEIIINIALGSLMAALLNGASNALNQIYDLEIDKINKPRRYLPSGKITIKEAWIIASTLFIISLTLAGLVNWQCFMMAAIATVMTYFYSAPPLRTKRLGIVANITIAIPRGVLLKVCGWSTVKTIYKYEPWLIGLIFGLFLLGATSTKDFSDIKGDRAKGCMTLPIKYGVRQASWMIAGFFVFPFLLMPWGVSSKILTGNPHILSTAGFVLSAWGLYVAALLVRSPEELTTSENHIAWKHMYWMMMATQVVFAVAYLI